MKEILLQLEAHLVYCQHMQALIQRCGIEDVKLDSMRECLKAMERKTKDSIHHLEEELRQKEELKIFKKILEDKKEVLLGLEDCGYGDYQLLERVEELLSTVKENLKKGV